MVPRVTVNRKWARGLALLLGVLVAGFFPGCSKPKPVQSELTLQFTCDVDGRLEPCGCFAGQFGGLTRLKTMLDAEPVAQVLRLDVGDAIGGHEDYDLIQYRYVLRAFGQMQYAALNVGAREAQLTLEQLRELRQASPVPMVSANLFDAAGGGLVFEPFHIVERGRFRIAILGVLDPRGPGDNLGAGLTVGDMANALIKQLPAARSKADLVVLLAFTDEATLAELARQFYEVQVILGGKVRQPSQALQRENRSLIYFVTNEARALGILRLLLEKGAPPQVAADEIRFLHDLIPQDEGFRAMAREYREEVRRTRLEVDDPANLAGDQIPGIRTSATYVGSAQCVDCHPSAAGIWRKSGHAHAFATLKERKADADPKCIGCHTTGFGRVSGYERQFGDTRLVDVGCESCHGPGSLHVRKQEGDASVNFAYRPLGAGDCQKCHHGEFSRPFDWEEFWPAIKHGMEPPKTASRLPAPAEK